MAKPTPHEKAWQRYIDLYNAAPSSRGGGSRKSARRARKAYAEGHSQYADLVAYAGTMGVRVREMTDEEIERQHTDARGALFRAGGTYSPAKKLISMRYQSTWYLGVLVHELAHAIDYFLGDFLGDNPCTSSERECIAIGVEYLVMVHLRGLGRTKPNTRYADRQKVTPEHVMKHRKRIEFIYDIIIEELDRCKVVREQEELIAA